jgi:hypothetical protein
MSIINLEGIAAPPGVEHGVGIYQCAFEGGRVPIAEIELGLPL